MCTVTNIQYGYCRCGLPLTVLQQSMGSGATTLAIPSVSCHNYAASCYNCRMAQTQLDMPANAADSEIVEGNYQVPAHPGRPGIPAVRAQPRNEGSTCRCCCPPSTPYSYTVYKLKTFYDSVYGVISVATTIIRPSMGRLVNDKIESQIYR